MLFNIIVKCYMFFKKIWYVKDYQVLRAGLEYLSPVKSTDFWRKEERYWVDEPSECYADVTNCFKNLTPTPEGVENTYLNIDYVYNGVEYSFVTSNINPTWPPKDDNEITFRPTIYFAMLLDKDKFPVREVTYELVRCMGPRKNFHGEDVPMEKLLKWDDYEFVQIKNILGIEKIIHKTSSCLELL